MKMISIKVKEAPFQVFYWLHISIQWWPGVAEKMNLNILVLVISIETDDSDKDADTKSTIFWWLMLLSTAENTTKKLTLGLTRKSQIHTHTVVQVGAGGGGGEGGGWNSTPEFLICCSILKRFYFQWKAFDLLDKMRYILGVVLLLEACSVNNNGRHLSHHLGFYQKLQIRLKLREMLLFLCFTWNITYK